MQRLLCLLMLIYILLMAFTACKKGDDQGNSNLPNNGENINYGNINDDNANNGNNENNGNNIPDVGGGDDENLPSHTHSPSEPVVENEIAATCTEEGNYDEVVYCSVCDTELTRETNSVAPRGHSPKDSVIENEIAATCTEEGSYDEVVYCSVCDTELTRETNSVATRGHSPKDSVIENEIAATCTEEGSYDEVVYCSVCDGELSREKTSIPMSEHNYVDFICTVCGAVERYSDNLELTLSSDRTYYSVTGIGSCTDTVIIIPVVYNDLPVKEIGASAFYNTNIVSVIIGDSVETICASAFRSCRDLKSITIGSGVKIIDEWAFFDCLRLACVTIPDSVTTIGDYAFYSCGNLVSFTIGDGVTLIGEYAFRYCLNLAEVINHSSLNIIAGSENYGCVAFYSKEVHTGESKVANIDDYIFYTYYDVNYLIGYVGYETELILPENYNGEEYEIYKYAFSNRDDITSVVISDGVTAIGEDAFYDCSNIMSVTIGNNVETIGNNAFKFCSRLTSITIGSGIIRIGECAFNQCSKLTVINYMGTAAQWNVVEKGKNWSFGTGKYTVYYIEV